MKEEYSRDVSHDNLEIFSLYFFCKKEVEKKERETKKSLQSAQGDSPHKKYVIFRILNVQLWLISGFCIYLEEIREFPEGHLPAILLPLDINPAPQRPLRSVKLPHHKPGSKH